jgi:uncharacterized protein YndB with AHSA1/START domain
MSESGITITRTFAAPRELVFDAWTDPGQFAAWWGGKSVDVPADSVTMDVRPGGAWKATMVLPDGNTINWVGDYVEVSRPGKLVFTLTDDASSPDRETLTVILTQVDGGTEMLVNQAGGFLPDDAYEAAIEGYNAFFDVMQDIVES